MKTANHINTPAAREQFDYDAWRAEQKAKRAAKIAARAEYLKGLGDPVINGRPLKVDGYATPDEDVEAVLLKLVDPREVHDTREGQSPVQYVIDVTLESDGVFYRVDLDRHHPNNKPGHQYERVGVAILDCVHTVSRHGFGKRVIAIYNVAETDDGDEMEPVNHL